MLSKPSVKSRLSVKGKSLAGIWGGVVFVLTRGICVPHRYHEDQEQFLEF